MGQPQHDTPRPRRIRRLILRGPLRLLQLLLILLVGYLLVSLIGLIPVNNDFEPTPDGVEIFVTSTAVHGDVVVPISNEVVDWREHLPGGYFQGDVSKVTHVAFGWGDKGFYINTPTWDDLTASVVARALFWPDESCMHVVMQDRRNIPADARAVRISLEQYRRLVQHVEESFVKDEDGRFVLIERAAYGSHDAFFEAHGQYHCLNTCNCWVGRGLRKAGVRCGCFTPLPKSMLVYLPD